MLAIILCVPSAARFDLTIEKLKCNSPARALCSKDIILKTAFVAENFKTGYAHTKR